MTTPGIAAPPERTRWAAIAALTLGIFTMITIEELPIGVLTLVADDFGVAHGVVGLSVTVPGVLAGVTAVVTPLVIGRLDRRLALVLALSLVFASATASALSTGIVMLLASRLFAGLAIGVFWALAAVVGTRISRPDQVARSLTVIYAGGSAAVVLGVPLSTWIGTALGWRWAFVVVGALGAAVAWALAIFLPRIDVAEPQRVSDLRRAWAVPGIRAGVAVTGLVVTAHFAAYTYASPLLQAYGRIDVTDVGSMLLVFGVAGMAGNFLAGPLIRRSPGMALTLVAVGLAAGVVLVGAVVDSPTSAAAVMAAWGLWGGAIGVVTQAWINHTSGDFHEAATAFNSGSFNVSIAGGALVGGLALDGGGEGAVLLVSGVGLAAAVLVAGLAWRRDLGAR